jgi:hypothetical protein
MICAPCFLFGLILDYIWNGKKNFTKIGLLNHIKMFFGGLIIGVGLLIGISIIKSWFSNKKD